MVYALRGLELNGKHMQKQISVFLSDKRGGKPWNKHIQIYLLYWSSLLSFVVSLDKTDP